MSGQKSQRRPKHRPTQREQRPAASFSKEQIEQQKQAAARVAAGWVRSGMTLGLGTGSTADHFIDLVGERVRNEGLDVQAVGSSKASEARAAKAGIRVIAPRSGLRLDLAVDGTDEITAGLDLIKGRGGALVREKIVARAADFFLVIADSSKRVTRLGKGALPVEVIPFALPWVMEAIAEMGGAPQLMMDRLAPGKPAVSDQQNDILDCSFGEIKDAARLAARLDQIPGVVGHGLFLGMTHAALIAEGTGVMLLRRGRWPCPASEFSRLPAVK